MNNCKKCGAVLYAQAPCCHICGEPVNNDERKKEVKEGPGKKIRGDVIALCTILGIMALVLVVGVIIAVINSGGGDDDDNYEIVYTSKPTATPTATPTAEPTPFKTSDYYVFKEDVTWHEANNEATKMGAELVCINDYDEFYKVCKKAEEKGLSVFWVGARRYPEQSWDNTRWESGEMITYANWFEGRPSYTSEEGEQECFLMVFKVDDEWYYNDAPNDVAKYYKGRMGYIVEVKE